MAGETPAACSFCGRSQDAVRTLIANIPPHEPAWICDVCVDVCVGTLVERGYAPGWLLLTASRAWLRRWSPGGSESN